MNKNILKISTLVAIWAFCSQNATAQQGFGTNQPSKASVIEMKSGNKGLLIPRVALTDLNNFGPIVGNAGITPAETNSLMVYNTTTDTTANLSAGYYYWTATDTDDGTIGHWQRFMTGTDEAALALDGDVTGPLNTTKVEKIQGFPVAGTTPNTNQVLTWNGTAWTPTSLTPAQITNKATLSVQDGIAIAAGSGTDALLGAATIGITDGGIAPVKIQPAAEPTTRMVMVTQTDGTVTWIPQTDIAPATTNALSSADNSMTSNVNGVSSSANIINTNGLTVEETELTSTVNGVPATVDLASVVQAAETLTSITQDASTGVITYEREREAYQTANVVNATSDNLISYDAGAFLNATTVQGAQKTTVVESGDEKYATVSPNTPQGSNETTYTVTVKAAPRFFYMPAVVFNTDNQTTGTTTLTRDLYELYANQFNGTAHHIVQGANTAGTAAVESVNYTGGVVSSANATNPLSSYLFTRGELEYHITYYDQTVFEIVGITEGGVLEYKIIGEATPMSYMNIVFVIK